MQEVFELIQRVAPANANVLISGESGTGVRAVIRVGEAVLTSPKSTAQGFEMDVGGIVATRTNLVQVSGDLIDWFSIQTNVPVIDGFHLLDSGQLKVSHRFYRVLIR